MVEDVISLVPLIIVLMAGIAILTIYFFRLNQEGSSKQCHKRSLLRKV